VVFWYADATTTHSGVIISANSVASLYQKIRVGETVHVHGSKPPINIFDVVHEKRISHEELINLPQPGATADQATGQVPGSQNDGHGTAYSGSTSIENRYLVDGIDITGLTFGDVGTPILNEFVHEIQAITGGYDAQYGRSTGGIVNIITRSGTNTLRGS